MQFQSTLARLAAFAFFLLSFSMLVCAAPAAVAAPGAGELAVRDSSLVARTYDYTTPCKDALVDVEVKIKSQCDLLLACSKTAGCDVEPILTAIVKLLLDFVASIKAQVALGATVDVNVVISICIDIIVYILITLKACVGITAALCVSLDAALKEFVQIILDLAINVVLRATILASIKAAVAVYLTVCLNLDLKLLLGVCGL